MRRQENCIHFKQMNQHLTVNQHYYPRAVKTVRRSSCSFFVAFGFRAVPFSWPSSCTFFINMTIYDGEILFRGTNAGSLLPLPPSVSVSRRTLRAIRPLKSGFFFLNTGFGFKKNYQKNGFIGPTLLFHNFVHKSRTPQKLVLQSFCRYLLKLQQGFGTGF